MNLTLSAVETLPPELTQLRADVRAFLDHEVAEGRFVPESDAWLSGIDTAFSRRLADHGWVGMTIPTCYGGAGRSDLERFIVTEELLAAGAPVAAHWVADRQMAPGILRNGTEEQKNTYLPGIARGERYFGIGMSEPDAGSDLAAIRTRAVESCGGWCITGTKLWTSGAHIATNMVLLARTDPSNNRHGGLSQFLVDLPHPDIHINPIITIDGGHHFNEVVFDDAFVPATTLFGERGAGWRQVTQELGNERSGPERILSTLPLLRAWARTDTIRADPMARATLGRLVSRTAVLRQLSAAVAQELAAGRNPVVEAAMVKDLGTIFEGEVVEAIRAHTGVEPDPRGDDFSALLAKSILHTPAFTLRGGTNEVLRSIVAKAVL